MVTEDLISMLNKPPPPSWNIHTQFCARILGAGRLKWGPARGPAVALILLREMVDFRGGGDPRFSTELLKIVVTRGEA